MAKIEVKYDNGITEPAGDCCDVCWSDDQELELDVKKCTCADNCPVYWCNFFPVQVGSHYAYIHHGLRRLHYMGLVSASDLQMEEPEMFMDEYPHEDWGSVLHNDIVSFSKFLECAKTIKNEDNEPLFGSSHLSDLYEVWYQNRAPFWMYVEAGVDPKFIPDSHIIAANVKKYQEDKF